MKLRIIFLILSLCLTGCRLGSSSMITKVEHGLRYNVLIKGEKDYCKSIADRMQYYKVPAVSIAIINDEKLEWAKGYGCISSETHKKIDSHTLFQAGSISKPVTAFGVLILVQQGKVSLDENVNTYLKSWKIPDNKFTKKEKVTLRRLVSHTAGTSVHGFPGYAVGTPIPSVVEILDGKKPRANTDPIRVTQLPGKEVRYSGGGTTIVQLLIEDVTGERFDTWMKNNVLIPFGMNASTFSQPLTQPYSDLAAYGHDSKGKPIQGNWHTYPEMAAAGLWTTPSDLAHFLAAILRILHGKQTGPVNQELVQEALKSQMLDTRPNKSKDSGVGLGFFFHGSGNEKTFGHGGKDEGFTANVEVWPEIGKGLVVMTNGDDGQIINEIKNSVIDAYGIPGHKPIIKNALQLDPSTLNQFTGVYKDRDHTMTINLRDNKLFLLDSYVPQEMQLYPAENNVFFMKEMPWTIQFLPAKNQIDTMFQFGDDGKRMRGKDDKEVVFKKSKD